MARSMGAQEAVRTVLQKYVDFSGRARRAEYWWFVLFSCAVSMVLIVIDTSIWGWDYRFGTADLFGLAVLLPSLSALVRRLHDIDKSGYWALLLLLPLVGALILIVWAAKPGTEGSNAYGADPLV